MRQKEPSAKVHGERRNTKGEETEGEDAEKRGEEGEAEGERAVESVRNV